MKKLAFILVICLGCIGILGAQNIWKFMEAPGTIMGVAANGDLFSTSYESFTLFRSQDEGETWQPVFENHLFYSDAQMAISPQGRIFALPSNEFCLSYSDDNGDIWHQTTQFTSCGMSGIVGLYAATNGIVMVWTENGETYWTMDGGATWSFAGLELDEESQVSDMIVNAEGDVYVSTWSYSDGDAGIFHSTLSDMQNWELVAAEGINITDMAFDPDGNVVACGWSTEGSVGFQHTPGFYVFGGTSLAIGDGGIVYTPHFMGLQAVLTYSTDHGEHFTEIGEHVPLVDIAPGGDNAHLFKGADNHLYFDGGGEYWKSIPDANVIPDFDGYFPLVQEGYDRQQWNVVYMGSMNYPNDYFTNVVRLMGTNSYNGVDYQTVYVKTASETTIPGIVREENKRVYFRSNGTGGNYGEEVLLYDFNLTVGDTVSVGIIGETLIVIEESETEVNGEMRRQLGLAMFDGEGIPREVEEYWIEGVGSTYGFLNSGYEGWSGSFVHLLCYHEDGDLLWQNEDFSTCMMNSEEEHLPFAPLGAEWYFNVASPYGNPVTYHHSYVIGQEEVQGRLCSNIAFPYYGAYGGNELVYEEEGMVYWYNGATDSFTVLYDFNADEGDSWVCEIGDCAFHIIVQSVMDVDYNGRVFRRQEVVSPDGLFDHCSYGARNFIIEGVGYVDGLFPYPWVCGGTFPDWPYPDYLRCYIVDGEMIIHGNEECDAYGCPRPDGLHFEGVFCRFSDTEYGDCLSWGTQTPPGGKASSLDGEWQMEYYKIYWKGPGASSYTAIDSVPYVEGQEVYEYVFPLFGLAPYDDYDYFRLTAVQSDADGNLCESDPILTPWGGDCVYVRNLASVYYGNNIPEGSEWFYEIQNLNGSTTYQHLEYVADTTINSKDVKIIIRTNTLYDKGRQVEVTHEYIYKEDFAIYWWNKTLQEFTMLYDYAANVGDEWDINVGTETITVHVDAIDRVQHDGIWYDRLHLSDADGYFSGPTLFNIGNLANFFPEALMGKSKGFRVNGLRCYWAAGSPVYSNDGYYCDEILGLGETNLESEQFNVYPNPTDGVLIVETQCFASQPTQTYHITNLMGQTLMSGNITAENQQIDVSGLPEGMYFISIGNMTRKFVVEK